MHLRQNLCLRWQPSATRVPAAQISCPADRTPCPLQIIVEDRVRIEPYAVVQPGSKLEAGFQLKAVRKSRSKLVAEKKDPLAMMKALSQQAAAAKAKSSGAAQRDIYKYAQPPHQQVSLSFTAMCVRAKPLPWASSQ